MPTFPTFDRITYTTETGQRTVILRAVRQLRVAGVDTLTGFVVTRDGDPTRELCILAVNQVIARKPMRMNLKYGSLEPTTNDKRQPYYPGRHGE